MSNQTSSNTPKRRLPRAIRILGIIAILLVVLIVAGPWIVAKTGLRDRIINAILASPSVVASSQNASFGWFSPMSLHGLQLNSTNNRLQVHVEDITAERSPWGLLASSPDLGTIRVEKPHLQLKLPLDLKIDRTSWLEPTFTAVVKDAALTVHVPELDEPVIDVDEISTTFRVEEAAEGRLLTLDPTVLFDRRKLSPKMGDKLLHLIDPTLGDTPQVGGEFSLSLDKLRIPIGIPREQMVQRIEVEGKLGLHQVTTEVKNPMRQALVQVLAEMNGKQASEVVRVVEDAEIRFQVRDGRMFHEGLRLGFPDIDPQLQVTSRGSVGLDKTLDLHLELPRLDKALRQEKRPVQCHITGTISNPKVSVQDASLVLRLPDHKEPLFAADGINLNMQVENAESGCVLAVEPVEIFKKEKVGLKLPGTLVRLIEPELESPRQVGGEISLALTKLRIPLGLTKDQLAKGLEVEGTLTLHQVSTEGRTPLRQALVKVLADLNGKQASDVVHIVKDAEIRFQVRDGRLHHEGLRIGFPEIDPGLVVSSRGSIGLDETLDLHVELPRLDKTLRKEKAPVQCHITGTLSNPKVSVQDASLVLRLPDHKEPLFAADGINLTMQVENTDTGRVLAVEPVEIFKKEKVSVGLPGTLVRLIEPELESPRQVGGEISLALTKLRIPLGLAKDQVAKDQLAKGIEVDGTLTLHQVSTEGRTPLRQALVKVLADLNGKQATDVVHIVKDAEIRFRVRDGRLHHEGLRIGFPEIDPGLVVSSRGSIGLDETLDLHVELPRLDKALRKEKAPVQCHITGTLSNPKVSVQDASLVLRLPDHKEPLFAADGINLTMQVENTDTGRVLAVEPVEIFKKEKVSVGLPGTLVRLIEPELQSPRQVGGEISLALTKLRIPLGLAKDQVAKDQLAKGIEVDGTLTLHQVSTEGRTPLRQALVKVLADLNGKQATDVVHIVKDAEIRFRVRDGRLHHDGLRIGFPEIDPGLVVSSRGSIGLDETLDLHLELPRLRKDKRQEKGPVQCHITGTLSNPKVFVKDASLVVHLTSGGKPTLDVDNVNLTFGVEDSKDGRMLTLAPITVFKKQKLTADMSADLVHLVAPTLGDIAALQGEISLSLDKLRIPLGVPKDQFARRVELAGKLQLHQISATVKEAPLLEAMVKVLADMHGKQPSEVVRVVENAEIQFQVRQGRMHHEGLRLGFPDISPDLLVSSRGSVGLDKSLDLMLEIPRILLKIKRVPADTKTTAPVRLHVTGSIGKPIVTEIKEAKGN